jgi:hypothetical protein
MSGYHLLYHLILFVFLSSKLFGQQKDSLTTVPSLCGNGLIIPYYANSGLRYVGDFYAIKEYVFTHYKKPTQIVEGSGIVRVVFVVNCKGEPCQYSMETYDSNYQKKVLDSAIAEQLLHLCRELKSWIPLTDEKGQAVNCRKFLAFKLEQGIITDILPK